MYYLIVMLSLFTIMASSAQERGKLILIADQFLFTEGPAADAQGDVYFTDQPNNSIWKYGANGSLDLFLQPAGRSNGLFIDREGYIVACADENNELWRIDPHSKAVDTLVSGYQGKRLNGPNDLWISPSGVHYLTDPYYQRDYWKRTAPELTNALYRWQGGVLQQVDADFQKPNGIIGSADGKRLYVADIGADKTYVYDITADGDLTNKRLFCNRGSDGMTLDRKGNLYLTGKGVFVYSQKGEQIKHIEVPAEWTANVCFAGKNEAYLFITASQKIFKIYPDW